LLSLLSAIGLLRPPCDSLTLPSSGRVRDFHPIVNAHAEHTKKEGPLAPLILHVTGYAPVRLPPCLSLGTDGNLSVVVILAGVCLVHQVAAEVGDIEPD